MGRPEQVAQWHAVHIQLLPPLGHTSGEVLGVRVRLLLEYQGRRDPKGPLIDDGIGHRGPTYHPRAPDAHPCVTQPWHADDAGVGENFWQILAYFWDLQVRGPPRGYFQDPTESILVIALRNMYREKQFFWGMGLKVVTGSRYLGSFVSDREAEKTWLAGKVQGW